MQMDSFYLILLSQGDSTAPYSRAEEEEINAAHREHLAHLHKTCHASAGPFGGPRGDLREMVLIPRQHLSLEDVQALVDEDPAIKAGLLRALILEWRVPEGQMPITIQALLG